MPDEPVASLIRVIIETVFNQGDYAAIDELLAPGSILHTPAWGMPANRLGFKQWIAGFRAGIPDLHCTLEDEIRSGDKQAAHWTMRGNQTGRFFGNLPTGRPVEVHGMIFARVENNRIVENWILVDQIGMLQQLGIVPPPARDGGSKSIQPTQTEIQG